MFQGNLLSRNSQGPPPFLQLVSYTQAREDNTKPTLSSDQTWHQVLQKMTRATSLKVGLPSVDPEAESHGGRGLRQLFLVASTGHVCDIIYTW